MRTKAPQFRMGPGKWIGLLLLALCAYLVALLVQLPAGWAWRWLAPQVDLPPGMSVTQVGGTVWQGAARVRWDNIPTRLTWSLQMRSLLQGQLPVNWTLESAQSRLQGVVLVLGQKHVVVNVHGQLYMPEFSRLVQAQGGANLVGSVTIRDLSLGWEGQGWSVASGEANWPGGLVTWPMGQTMQQTTMPPMQALLRRQGQVLTVSVSKTGDRQAAARVNLSPDGVVELLIYRHLLDLAGQSWPASVGPGAIVFRMRQKVLPAFG